MEGRGRYSRGYLSHIDGGQQPVFVTWRLKDSLPPRLYAQWKVEVNQLPEDQRRRELHRLVETHLDRGFGSQILRNPVAAKIVQDALIFGHQKHYDLTAWVVMPTHVHSLFAPKLGCSLANILKSLKGFSSREIGKKLNMPGRLWQEESFDILIRDEKHFAGVWQYIERNPVKAGLCIDPKEFAYSSANPTVREKLLGGLDVDV